MLNCLNPFHFCASFLLGDQIITCGLGVLENGYLGLFDITVDVKYRNHGYGMELVKNLLSVGKSYGAKQAYLLVMLNNQPALHLYKKLGFAEQYKYHYRVLSE